MSRLRLKVLVVSAAFLLTASAAQATPINIGFDALGGANGDAFLGYSEQGFTVTPTQGNWFVAKSFGNPTPDIFAGPIGSPSPSNTITVTGPQLFTPISVDIACNGGTPCAVAFSGSRNGSLVFSVTTSIGTPNTFFTFTNNDPTRVIDTYFVRLGPGVDTTSMNIDNIRLNTVPEPATLALVGSGLAMAARRYRRARRA